MKFIAFNVFLETDQIYILYECSLFSFFQKVRVTSPSAELFRSIDYYMLFCNLFVFAALAETTLVGMTAPNSKPVTAAQQLMDIMQNDDDDDDEENIENAKPSVYDMFVFY